MRKIRLVILGVGRWGVHLLRNFLEHPQAEIIAIVDPRTEYLGKCQASFNLQGILLTESWESVRKLPNIDAVVIVTPASTHYQLIKDALQLGYHVFTEKPLTLSPQDSLELTNLAKQQNRQLFVDHTYLFHPVVEKAKEIVDSGQIGNRYYGYATRTNLGPVRGDVDVLWDLALHDLAILSYWLGETPQKVQAEGHTWLQSTKGLSDLVLAKLLYPSGFQAFLHFSWLNCDKQRRLCLVGESGSLIFDELLIESPLTLVLGHFQSQQDNFNPVGLSTKVIDCPKIEPLKKVCASFLESISNDLSDPRANGNIATQLIQIISCLSESIKQQGEWVIVNPAHSQK